MPDLVPDLLSGPSSARDPAARPAFTGLILAGGRSSRMGTDKAFLEIGGVPLVSRLDATLREADAFEVLVVGGDRARLASLGLDARSDDHPGEGPLGGLLTALRSMTTDLGFVTACDHPALDAQLPSALIDRWLATGADACVPIVDDIPQVLAALYHRHAIDPLSSMFTSGERSLRRAASSLVVDRVIVDDPSSFVDLDSPEDLQRILGTS